MVVYYNLTERNVSLTVTTFIQNWPKFKSQIKKVKKTRWLPLALQIATLLQSAAQPAHKLDRGMDPAKQKELSRRNLEKSSK